MCFVASRIPTLQPGTIPAAGAFDKVMQMTFLHGSHHLPNDRILGAQLFCVHEMSLSFPRSILLLHLA